MGFLLALCLAPHCGSFPVSGVLLTTLLLGTLLQALALASPPLGVSFGTELSAFHGGLEYTAHSVFPVFVTSLLHLRHLESCLWN